MTERKPDDWTTPDAHRVLMVGLFRWINRGLVGDLGVGSLPWNGTEGEMREEDAIVVLDNCPGLRFVMEAGLRSLTGDAEFQAWLLTLWSGSREECEATERVLLGRLASDEKAWAALS